MKKCTIKGCGGKFLARGMCRKHYLCEWKKKESGWEQSFEQRFNKKWISDSKNECWLWTDKLEHSGYGKMRYKNLIIKAHRAAYEIFFGKIPHGLSVLHRCDVRSCVNPKHLFLGTQQDNMDDMKIKGRERHQQGECVGTAKLSGLMINEIRMSSDTHKNLAEKYSVSRASIHNIKKGKSWKHVPWPCESSQYDGEDSRTRSRI